MNIPEEIELKRKRLGETRKQFGNRFGVSSSTVFRWEKGEVASYTQELIYFVHDCKVQQVGNFRVTKRSNRVTEGR